jgi:uncharacterized protein YggE
VVTAKLGRNPELFMRNLVLSLLALAPTLAVTVPATAQTPPATLGDRYVPAPWWMREPVIASIGYVRVELPANRANFSANFQVVDRSSPDATAKATDKVRELAKALQTLGADKVRIETTFTTRPLYEQYRDKEGNVQENQRADKIERYEVDAVNKVEVRDIRLLEQTYAAVVAAKPTTASNVIFHLDPDNETKTALYTESIKDAARRAKLSVEAAGGGLGGIKVIDPTGRACQTDVLAGWPSYGGGGGLEPTTVPAGAVRPLGFFGAVQLRGGYGPDKTLVLADGKRLSPDGNADVQFSFDARGTDAGVQPEALTLPLQPPLVEMIAQSCVVYGLT